MYWLRGLVLPAMFLGGVLPGFSLPQSAKPATDVSSSLKKGLELAQSGHCPEAAPLLKKSAQAPEKGLKLEAGLAGARCAMLANDPDAATEFLRLLNRDFPGNPEVLYMSAHAYSDLSTRAALELAKKAPESPQAHQLNAESLEMQGKWDLAAAEYRTVLKENPQLPGIHFRLGRLLLSKPNPPADVAAQAKQEFEAELKLDPSNAGAEYVLGELAREAQQWDEAVSHFSRAAKLDPQFGDAFLGLGESLIAAKKFAEAVPPLETAAKLEPGNPTAHFHLATAYRRVGRKAEADKEFAIHREMTQKGGAEQNDGVAEPGTNPN